MINIKGINFKKKHHIPYPDVTSNLRQIPHGSDLPVPEPDGNVEYSLYSKHSDMTVVARDDAYKPEENDQPVPLTQADLTQDLKLLKESAQLLSSGFKEKHLLVPRTTFYWFQDHARQFRQFYTLQNKSLLAYCNNIAGFINGLRL